MSGNLLILKTVWTVDPHLPFGFLFPPGTDKWMLWTYYKAALRRSCTNSPAPTPTRTSTSSFSSLLSWLQSKAFLQGLTSRAMTAVRHGGDVSWTVRTDPWKKRTYLLIWYVFCKMHCIEITRKKTYNIGSLQVSAFHLLVLCHL